MAVFKSLGETADGAADKVKDYAKYTEAYIKLQIFKHIAGLTTFVFKLVLIGGFILTALLFLSVSLIVVLSDWFGSLVLALCQCRWFVFGVRSCHLSQDKIYRQESTCEFI